MGIANPFTICLREDGSYELEENASGGIYVGGEALSLREPQDPSSSSGGPGRRQSLEDETDHYSFYRQENAKLAQKHTTHLAAVRLGTKGGIASGISRQK